MKYFILAGEASGDLHASALIRALRAEDPEAQFAGLGGDKMAEEGCRLYVHYREMVTGWGKPQLFGSVMPM